MISMFQTWRWKLRAAQQACDQGRLDEAVQRLQDDDLRQFQPAQPLLSELAAKLERRALARLASAEPQAAWRDVRVACDLAGETASILETRRLLVQGELEEAQRLLSAGQSAAARGVLERLMEQRASNELVRGWFQVALHCDAARQLQARGRFAEAEGELRQAVGLRPGATFLTERLARLALDAERGRTVTDALQAAATSSDWAQVRTMADELLQLAPECEWAKDLRQRAWGHLAPRTQIARSRPQLAFTQAWSPSTIPMSSDGSGATGEQRETGERFLLWVDAVGGYLVCLGNEVLIGQPSSRGGVDVPVLGDLSRQHAMVRRDGEHYLIQPLQAVRVRGQRIQDVTLLRDGDEIWLGEHLHLRFRQPHVLSASARLEWISRHRTQPAADAILLMAESLVLGPDRQNHVVCRQWTHDLVIYRRDGELYCRAAESLEVDGRWREGEVLLNPKSRIAGRDFAVSLEPV